MAFLALIILAIGRVLKDMFIIFLLGMEVNLVGLGRKGTLTPSRSRPRRPRRPHRQPPDHRPRLRQRSAVLLDLFQPVPNYARLQIKGWEIIRLISIYQKDPRIKPYNISQ